MTTRVINLVDAVATAKAQVEGSAVFIGRPSKWGNRFPVLTEDLRATAIAEYAKWLLTQPALLALIETEIKDKTLICFCKPRACHGDVLALIADRGVEFLKTQLEFMESLR